MSTADSHAQRSLHRRRCAGYTALEMIISIGIIALMALVVERTLASTHDAERQLNAVRVSTERGQKLAYEVREAVAASRKLFGNDALGQGYLTALDLTRDPLASGARMPVFDEVNGLGPDVAGDPRTGNMLLFVREADAAPAVADPVTGKTRFIDTYRFVCIYPSETNRYLIVEDNRQFAKDLVMWRSVPFPSHSQIMGISDPTERANVVADLYNRFEYETAWDPNQDVDNSFFAIDNLGNVGNTPIASMDIDEDVDISDRGRLVYAHVQLARTDATSHPRRSIFTLDSPATWTPDGFETKIVGASGSRKVWMHLVVEVQAAKGRVAAHASTVIAATKDL